MLSPKKIYINILFLWTFLGGDKKFLTASVLACLKHRKIKKFTKNALMKRIVEEDRDKIPFKKWRIIFLLNKDCS